MLATRSGALHPPAAWSNPFEVGSAREQAEDREAERDLPEQLAAQLSSNQPIAATSNNRCQEWATRSSQRFSRSRHGRRSFR